MRVSRKQNTNKEKKKYRNNENLQKWFCKNHYINEFQWQLEHEPSDLILLDLSRVYEFQDPKPNILSKDINKQNLIKKNK